MEIVKTPPRGTTPPSPPAAHADLATAVRIHGGWLLRWFESRVPATVDAEDLVQEVFLAVHRNWPRLRDPQRLGPYLYRIAERLRRRTIARSLRRSAVERHIAAAADPPLIADAAAGDDDRRLREAMRTLPDDIALAVASYYAGGGSYDAAAARIGISRTTLQSRLRRGLTLLRDRLRTPP